MQVELKVLGGLPVTVEYEVEGPDESVGLFGYALDDWRVIEINGRKCKKAPQWLYDRIDAKKGEKERIELAIMESFDDREPYFDEPDY